MTNEILHRLRLLLLQQLLLLLATRVQSQATLIDGCLLLLLVPSVSV
jgi:hypothetical protein